MITAENLYWDRIYAKLELQCDDDLLQTEDLHFYLINDKGEAVTEFECDVLDSHHARLTLNVTNNGFNRCIENGSYRILAAAREQMPTPVFYCGAYEALADCGRSFNYKNNRGVYTVTYIIAEDADPVLFMRVFNTSAGNFFNKENSVAWALSGRSELTTSLKSKIKKYYQRLADKIQTILYRLVRKLYRGKNHLLFLSEQNDGIALNMKALYDRMLERGLDREYTIDTSFRRSSSIHYSKFSTLKVTILIAKADIIIVDDHVPIFDRLILDPHTRLIQIWHAGAGFKGVGYSRWGHHGCPGPFSCHRQYDYCISGSASISEFFSEQFGILDEQVIPTGMPRMDKFIDPENRRAVTERLYERYPALRGKRVVLFAPTYRGRNRRTAFYPYELVDFSGLYDYACRNDAVILFKMHPWVPGEVPIDPAYADRFFSMNDYPDINELFYITDLLITDYSSCMFEFLLMRKPMLFFSFDKNQFSSTRGFHRDYDSNVPGKICERFEDLLQCMENEDFEFEKVDPFIQKYFDHVDSNSCDRIIDWLIQGDLPEPYASALKAKQEKVRYIRTLQFDSLETDSDSFSGVG